MANRNIDGEIILGISAQSKNIIEEDLKKILSQIDNLETKISHVKLDANAIKELEQQINSLKTTINISNINLNQNQLIKQAGQVGQQIGNQINSGINSIIQKRNFKNNFTFSENNKNNIANEAEQYFKGITNGIVTVKEQMQNLDGSSSLKGFTVNIEHTKGVVEQLNYSLKNITDDSGKITGKVFEYTNGTINDNGVIKQLQQIENEFANYTQKIEQFKSTNSNILSGLTAPLSDFENKLAGLKNGTFNVNELKNSFNMLKAEASKIISNLSGDLNKVDKAVRNIVNGEQILSGLKAEFKGLNNAPKEINSELNNLYNSLNNIKKIENQEGRTTNWTKAYQEWASAVDSLKSKLATLKKEQSNTASTQIFKTDDLDKNNIAYMSKVFNTIERQMVRIQSMANGKGWNIVDVTGIERSDGLIKKLTLTVTDAEGALKRINFQREKIQGSGKVQNALIQVGDVQVLKTAAQAQQELIDAMAKGREKSEQLRASEEKRQQLSNNNVINKQLESEYQERQKNIKASERQLELDKQKALNFTKSSSKKLSAAISKYTYGDSTAANAMTAQMNKGLSNFGDMSNIQNNIETLSSQIDKIISDLKTSHQQSLQALNDEIKAEQALQSQKDNFNQKNINAIDFEIQKREEESKRFSSMLKAQMEQEEKQRVFQTQQQEKLLTQSNKIQFSIDTGAYESKVQSLISQTQQWTNEQGEARISTTALSNALNQLNIALTALSSNNTVENQKALINAEQELDKQIKSTTNSIKQMNLEFAKDTAISSLHNKIQEFYDKNGAAHKHWGAQLRQMLVETNGNATVTKQRIQEIATEFNNIGMAARQAGKLGQTAFQQIFSKLGSLTTYTSASFMIMKGIQSIRSGLSTIRGLDTALVDLKKTTTMTSTELEDFYKESNKVAKDMGVTTKQIIDQASAWSRLGFSSAEAAKGMAKYSSMFKLISPGMDLDSATDGLVSVMKAYDIEVNDVVDGIMSKINIIGNSKALNNTDIIDFLRRSSSALASANNSLEESIAMGEAIVEITRDAAGAGQVLKTTSMRIRGYDEDTESYSEELENLKGKIADLTKTAKTPGGISLFTDKTKETYKSTYRILEEISEIWNDLTDKNQANIQCLYVQKCA